MDPASTSAGGAPGGAALAPVGTGTTDTPWHEGIVAKEPDGTEKLADPATWLDRAPKPLSEFVRAQMTAARAKTDGMVKVPSADAKPEEWEAFYRAAGRPEKPEDYGLKAPEKLPDGVV